MLQEQITGTEEVGDGLEAVMEEEKQEYQGTERREGKDYSPRK